MLLPNLSLMFWILSLSHELLMWSFTVEAKCSLVLLWVQLFASLCILSQSDNINSLAACVTAIISCQFFTLSPPILKLLSQKELCKMQKRILRTQMSLFKPSCHQKSRTFFRTCSKDQSVHFAFALCANQST